MLVHFFCHYVIHLNSWNCSEPKFARRDKIQARAKELSGTIAKYPVSKPKRNLQEGNAPNNGKNNNKNNNNKNNNNKNNNNKGTKAPNDKIKIPKETKAPTVPKTSKPSGKEFHVHFILLLFSIIYLFH